MGEGDKQRTKSFYAISAGRRTRIFTKWPMCHRQVNQFSATSSRKWYSVVNAQHPYLQPESCACYYYCQL